MHTPVNEHIPTIAELEAKRLEMLETEGVRNRAKAAVELHGKMQTAKNYHDEHPDEPFDNDAFIEIAKSLLKDGFGVDNQELGSLG